MTDGPDSPKRLTQNGRRGTSSAPTQSSGRIGPVDISSLDSAIGRVLQAGSEPLRAAFLARALNALVDVALGTDADVMGDAAGASSGYAVLTRALAAPGALAALLPNDPLAAARLRGLAMRQEILQRDGGVFSAEQVASVLGLTRQAVDKRRRAGKLIGLNTGRRGYAYPTWQFDQGGVLRGLEEVVASLNVHDPWMQAAFFLSGDPRLEGARPLDELRKGNVAAVMRAASGYGEHGAA
jgi:hypothetical protein